MRPRSTKGSRRLRARANPGAAQFEFAHLLDSTPPSPDGSEKAHDVSIALAEPRCLVAAELDVGRLAVPTTEVTQFRQVTDLVQQSDMAGPEVTAHDEPESDVDPEPAAELEPVLQPVLQVEVEVEVELQPEFEVEPEPEPEPVSRFAAAGLDDDRLPLPVKRRRGLRQR